MDPDTGGQQGWAIRAAGAMKGGLRLRIVQMLPPGPHHGPGSTPEGHPYHPVAHVSIGRTWTVLDRQGRDRLREALDELDELLP